MNKYVLITGGTKGIGYAVAECLAKEQFDLLLTYSSDAKRAEEAAQALVKAYDISVDVVAADISEAASIDTLASFVEKNNRPLDALVFNAGLTCRDSLEDLKPEDWARVLYANIQFPVFLLQRLLPRIVAGGSVVFTGSLMGIQPHSVSLAYGVSKSAVHSLTRNLVKSLAPYHIRVNAVAPGFVDTEWQKTKPAEIRANIERKVALGRFCEPEEVADVYKMLITNTYFNGEVIVIDGGYSYQ